MNQFVVLVEVFFKILVALLLAPIRCCCERYNPPQRQNNNMWIVSPEMYLDEKAMLREMFGSEFRFDWECLVGVCSRDPAQAKDSDSIQINWYRDDANCCVDVVGAQKLGLDSCVMRWFVRNGRVHLISVRFYLGRKYHVLDDVVLEEEQYLEVDLQFNDDSTNCDGGFSWWVTRDRLARCTPEIDPITEEVYGCMQEVWKLSAAKDPSAFRFCPFSRRREFAEIMSCALSANGFAAPFRVGGYTTKQMLGK